MFSFYKVILDLLKARTHKYVRRVPIGSTHTGGTKYKYYYQEQAGHGKGLGHESELVKDASFAFGEGENKYHAHIKSVDGDKLTIEYDDGDKKGQKETLSKTEFQNRIHKEHATSIKNAHEKAKKQLATFEKMKTTGAKVKDSTLDKLKAQVNKLDSLEAKKPEAREHIEGEVKNGINTLPNNKRDEVPTIEPNFKGKIEGPTLNNMPIGRSMDILALNPKTHKKVFFEKNANEPLKCYVQSIHNPSDFLLLWQFPDSDNPQSLSIQVDTKDLQTILQQRSYSYAYGGGMKFYDGSLYLPAKEKDSNGRTIISNDTFYKLDTQKWDKAKIQQREPTKQEKTAQNIVDRIHVLKDFNDALKDLSVKNPTSYINSGYYPVGLGAFLDHGYFIGANTNLFLNKYANPREDDGHISTVKNVDSLKIDLLDEGRINSEGQLKEDITYPIEALETKDPEKTKGLSIDLVRKWDKYEESRWENVIKPALKKMGFKYYKEQVMKLNNKKSHVHYSLPLELITSKPKDPIDALKDLFDNSKLPKVDIPELTESQKTFIEKYNNATVKGFQLHIFDEDQIGDKIENSDMGNKDPDKLYLYAEGGYKDREALAKLGFKFVQKKEGSKGVSYYKYKAPVSKQ